MRIDYLVFCCLVASAHVSLAESGPDDMREALRASVGGVKGRKQNLVTKKQEAETLCDKLLSIDKPLPEDAELLGRYLTLADPRQLGEGMKSPTEAFPAVKQLIRLGKTGAEAAVGAVKYEQVNDLQTPLNVAYVLSHTVGAKEGLKLIKTRRDSDKYTGKQLNVLQKVETILSAREAALASDQQE
jgi:hypothetical protein